jgi:hypothetical protein
MSKRHFTPLVIAACALGCKPSPESAAGVEAPPRQFAFEGVTMEEREQSKLVWHATAARADGDLGSSDALDIRMTHFDQESGTANYLVLSPRGRLEMDNRKAHFEEVRIDDLQGGLLTAGTADYDGAGERIEASGPLEFAAPGLVAHATRGEVHLASESMSIDGPVTGRFEAGSSHAGGLVTPRARQSRQP